MTEYLKIKEGVYIDLEDLWEKICVPRNVKTVSEIIEEQPEIVEEEEVIEDEPEQV